MSEQVVYMTGLPDYPYVRLWLSTHFIVVRDRGRVWCSHRPNLDPEHAEAMRVALHEANA